MRTTTERMVDDLCGTLRRMAEDAEVRRRERSRDGPVRRRFRRAAAWVVLLAALTVLAGTCTGCGWATPGVEVSRLEAHEDTFRTRHGTEVRFEVRPDGSLIYRSNRSGELRNDGQGGGATVGVRPGGP